MTKKLVRPLLLLVLLVPLVGMPGAFADEILLRSGAKLTGTIERETESEIEIVTDLGRMTVARSLVEKITRDGGAPEEAPETGPVKGTVVRRLAGLAPDTGPVCGGTYVVLRPRTGGVRAVSAEDGDPLWSSDAPVGEVTGVAADPGGVYVCTKTGQVLRLNAQTGVTLWTQEVSYELRGDPLLHRRGVFVVSPGLGLFGLESATGGPRGLLRMAEALDAPLATIGSRIVSGDTRGRLVLLGEDGTEIATGPATGVPWGGRPIAAALRMAMVAAPSRLLTIDPAAKEVRNEASVPGLRTQPFAADPSRVYAEVSGMLSAVDSRSGRIAWRCSEAGRVTHVVGAGDSLLVATADGFLLSLARSNGQVEWSVELGARAVAPPVLAGKQIFVATASGECLLIEEVRKEKEEEGPTAETPPPRDERRALHSPLGFSLVPPEAWILSEDLGRGPVSLGFRPIAESPRFLLRIASAEDRRRFEVTGRLTVTMSLAPDLPLDELAGNWVARTKARALRARAEVTGSTTSKVGIGDRTWVRATVETTLGSGGEAYVTRALFARMPKERFVAIEMHAPRALAATVSEDLQALAESFEPEDPSDYAAPPEVQAAEAFAAALTRGDAAALASLLAEPLRRRLAETVLHSPGRCWIPVRSSRTEGRLREVRVRLDTDAGTRYARVVLGAEGDGWVVVDAGALLP